MLALQFAHPRIAEISPVMFCIDHATLRPVVQATTSDKFWPEEIIILEDARSLGSIRLCGFPASFLIVDFSPTRVASIRIRIPTVFWHCLPYTAYFHLKRLRRSSPCRSRAALRDSRCRSRHVGIPPNIKREFAVFCSILLAEVVFVRHPGPWC